jgi:hypothetical protein
MMRAYTRSVRSATSYQLYISFTALCSSTHPSTLTVN